MEPNHGAFLLDQLKRAVENVKLARRCQDDLWEQEALAKLDLAWAALNRERRRPDA
jgi:hypothetical protein